MYSRFESPPEKGRLCELDEERDTILYVRLFVCRRTRVCAAHMDRICGRAGAYTCDAHVDTAHSLRSVHSRRRESEYVSAERDSVRIHNAQTLHFPSGFRRARRASCTMCVIGFV